MSKPLVSIIILTYKNGLQVLDVCLSSLAKATYKNTEIIVVDNVSTDDTVSLLRKKYPKVKIIENKKNLGFCVGNNQATKIARGKYLLFLNNDTKVSSEFLDILVNTMEKDISVGVVQPKLRQILDQSKLDACASYMTITGFLYHYGYSQNQNKKQYNDSLFMYSAKGACFITSREIVEKIGLFDPDYFAYFEETDFCHRVWLAGYKVVYQPRAEIFHLGGADRKEDHPAVLQFISYRNRLCTYIKNLGIVSLVIILPMHLSICFLLIIVYLLTSPNVSIAISKAVFWNLVNLEATLKKRRLVQEKRVLSDSRFFKHVFRNPGLLYYFHFFWNPRGQYNEKAIS